MVEKSLSLKDIHLRLEEGRKKDLSPSPWATKIDYIILQGGVPDVTEDDSTGLTKIIHVYDPTSPTVESHKKIEDYGSVKITWRKSRRPITRTYAAALLWSEHGGPCDRESRKRGGGGY